MKPETDILTLLFIALAAISGALGGCAVASIEVARGRKFRFAQAAAYLFIGLAFGVLFLAFGARLGIQAENVTELVGYSILFGGAGALMLASHNLCVRWVLRRFGMDITVTVRKNGEDRRAD